MRLLDRRGAMPGDAQEVSKVRDRLGMTVDTGDHEIKPVTEFIHAGFIKPLEKRLCAYVLPPLRPRISGVDGGTTRHLQPRLGFPIACPRLPPPKERRLVRPRRVFHTRC
jgi:hypothetical protein